MAAIYIGKNLELEQTQRALFKNGNLINLSELNYRLLSCLVANAPHVTTYQTLQNEVWKETLVSEDTIKKRVSRLREILQTHPEQNIIVAERGIGYRLALPIQTHKPKGGWLEHSKWKLIAFMLILFSTVGLYILNQPNVKPTTSQSLQPLDPNQKLLKAVEQYLDLREAKQVARAIRELEVMLDTQPESLPVLAALSNNYLVNYQLHNPEIKQLYQANHFANQAVQLHPQQPWAHLALAKTLILLGQVPQAISHGEQAVELATSWVDGYVTLAQGYRVMGDIGQAWTVINKAYDLQPDNPKVQLARVQVLIEKEMTSWVRDNVNQLGDSMVDDPYVAMVNAEQLMVTKQFQEAERVLLALLERYPNAYKAQFLLALTYDLKGEQERAIRYYKDLTRYLTPYSGLAGEFVSLLAGEQGSFAQNHYMAFEDNQLLVPLSRLNAQDPAGFLAHLENAVDGGFSKLYFLQSSLLNKAFERQAGGQPELLARFAAIKKRIHERRQARRVKRMPVLSN
ncbi:MULTISPECIES: winged helix-turn-helix domain-containing protein [unclassified Pseudoalteromonas]|uniref:winged helix-turn-helix domain-containing protein n=1 Tax=unclassified Pseudoalteromonas TaxID=194690 RepID=UPI003014E4E0